MEDSLIIKKIYINDYIINTTLLDRSLFNLLVKTLSNKFYKTDKLEYKVNHILKKIDNIFYNNSGQKIFNLAYQPFNQENIITNYKRYNFNKKWIIPIVNEKKNLNQKILEMTPDLKYNNENNLLLSEKDSIFFYNDTEFDPYSEENHFEISDINFKKLFINLLNSSPGEFSVLEDENVFSSNTALTSSNDSKIIRESDKHTYYMSCNNKPILRNKKKIYVKEIKETFNQVRNILKGEDINITKFLILNPIKLLTSNYNISIGNTISYLGEILYNNNSYDININNYIDNIINNSQENLKKEDSFFQGDDLVEYYTVNVNEFKNEYNNNNGYIWNYLKIAQNIDKISENNEIKSIKILKHIYNLFGYDLNKIPFCYLKYLKNILQHNIYDYIVKNLISINNPLLELYNKYKTQKISYEKNAFTKLIQDLYNIEDIENISEDNLYVYLVNNTPDKGGLFYIHQYMTSYLDKNHILPQKTPFQVQDNDKSIECQNYRLVKTYNSIDEYTADTNKFVDSEYSELNYLVEYSDLIGILNNEEHIYNNNLYQLDVLVKLDNGGKNKLDVKKDHIKEVSNSVFNTFIKENKLYLYDLLFNKSDFDLDILFNKLTCFKHKNKHYIQIPIQQIQDFNIIYITNTSIFYYIQDNNLNPIESENDIEYINQQYIEKCKTYNEKNIEINNSKDKTNFYESLHTLKLTHYKKTELLLNNLQSKNMFYNEIINRTAEIKETQFYFKNLPFIEYTITNYNDPIIYSNFIQNLSNLKIKFDNISLNELKTNLNESDKLSPSIQNIKIKDQDIQNLPNSELWGTVHRYINEYELFHTHIIENPNKHTRAYYKMRELMIDDDIIKKPGFRLISLAEAPGFFANCIKDLVQNSEWESYKIYTWLLDRSTTQQKNFWKSFNGHIWGANENGPIDKKNITGDLTDVEQIKKIINDVGENKADLITADGGIEKRDNEDYILEEYNHFPLFLGEIITALFTQNIDGTFILKMYDISYINTINLLHILNYFYKSVKIIKPYTSRPCNSEKYIKCENYKGFEGLEEVTVERIKTNLFTILTNSKNKNAQTEYKYIDIFKTFGLDNVNILKFNESINVKTRELYTQHIYDILKRQDSQELELINTYFTDTNKITNILENSDDKTKGYFITKIENCIRLAQYLQLTTQIKPLYIDFYKNNHNTKFFATSNIYPPHFKNKYEIDMEKNPYEKIPKIIKFVNKYCILFKNFGENKILDEKIYRITYLFITNPKIIEITHPLIKSIELNLTNPSELYKILISLCKKQNINSTFNLYKTNTINLIIKYQNNIRHLIGWYLCKYTYIPMFPRYMIYDNVEDQIQECGVKVNSHQYICCYSGDKLDKEDFDDFMGVGDNIHRTTIDIIETDSITKTETMHKITSKIIPKTTHEKICSYILIEIFNIKDQENINHCLSNIINKKIDISDLSQEYNRYFDLLNQQFSTLGKAKTKKDIESLDNYLKDIDKFWVKNSAKGKPIYAPIFHIPLNELDTYNNPLIKNINTMFLKHILHFKTTLTIDTFIIQHLLYLHFSEYIYSKYLSTILYTLCYITQITEKNTSKTNLKKYISEEKKLFNYLLNIDKTEFEIFKNQKITDYNMHIDVTSITENTTIDELKNLLEEQQIKTIIKHITPTEQQVDEKEDWINFPEKKLQERLEKLQNSKTVVEFLLNCNKFNTTLYVKFINILIEQNLNFEFKYEFKNYISNDKFTELLTQMNSVLKGQPISNTNNIENNINHNRTELSNYSILNYIKTKNIFFPDYEYSNNTYQSEYNFDSSIYYFKYLYLNVYEKDNQFYGQKRFFKKTENIYTCIYTNKTKNQILEEINSLDNLKEIYEELLSNKKNLLNNSDFINKNTLLNANIYSSLINNVCYSFSLNNIDMLYKYITLFYKTLETDDNDKNIIMRFYNDPVDNIITFLNKHKEQFIISFPQLTDKINNILELNEMTPLYNISSKITIGKEYKIVEDVIKLNKSISEKIKSMNINLDILDNLSINELINIIQNIKQKLSYITNYSNETQQFDFENIQKDLKNKYKFIKNKYITDSAEYESLIRLVNKFYNFSLDDYELNTLQVVFKKLLDSFNFYPTNIVLANNTDFNKIIIIHKIYIILDSCFNILNNDIEVNSQYFKEKFYLHSVSEGYSLLQNIEFNQPTVISVDTKYKDLFKIILNDTITSINEYSTIITDFEYTMEDDGIENGDNYDNNGSFDEIEGSVEDS